MALEDNPNCIHAEFEYGVTGGVAKPILVVYTDLDLDPSAGNGSAIAALVDAATFGSIVQHALAQQPTA